MLTALLQTGDVATRTKDVDATQPLNQVVDDLLRLATVQSAGGDAAAHAPLLERTVAALADLPVRALVSTGRLQLDRAPNNVHLAAYVPHAQVLPQATAVVTHAGLGTVHAALAHGLPLVCLPIGRDQPDNAARVAWHGAGLRLSPNSRAGAIQAAVQTVLIDESLSAAARRLSRAITGERPADVGPGTLERLVGIGSSMTAPVLEGVAPTPAKPRA